MDNVVAFNGHTKLDIDTDKVLEGAKGKLSTAIVIGYCDNEPNGMYFASSTADIEKVMFMIEKVKFKVLHGDFN